MDRTLPMWAIIFFIGIGISILIGFIFSPRVDKDENGNLKKQFLNDLSVKPIVYAFDRIPRNTPVLYLIIMLFASIFCLKKGLSVLFSVFSSKVIGVVISFFSPLLCVLLTCAFTAMPIVFEALAETVAFELTKKYYSKRYGVELAERRDS